VEFCQEERTDHRAVHNVLGTNAVGKFNFLLLL